MSKPREAAAAICQRDFARYAAYIASHAATWASECMDGDIDKPMTQDAIDRFTARMKAVLVEINGK